MRGLPQWHEGTQPGGGRSGPCASLHQGCHTAAAVLTHLERCSGAEQPLPHAYAGVTPDHLPGELFPGATVVEHLLPASDGLQPTCAFVVDTCTSEEQLRELKVRGQPLPALDGKPGWHQGVSYSPHKHAPMPS